jgi:hypothetical protein
MITGDAFFDRTVKIDGTSYDYIIVAMHPGFRKRILQMIADDGLFFLSFKRNEFELAF